MQSFKTNFLIKSLTSLILFFVSLTTLADSFNDAKTALKNKDYEAAITLFQSAANEGNSKAQLELSKIYYKGKVTSQDYLKAYVWAEIAAFNGAKNNAGKKALRNLSEAENEKANNMILSWKIGFSDKNYNIENDVVKNGGGVILDIKHEQGYSYALVEKDNFVLWAAAPTSDAKTGDTVFWTPGANMTNFYSKALDQTFAHIIFVDQFEMASLKEETEPKTKVTVKKLKETQGVVKSLELAKGYLYLKIATSTGDIWAATPEVELELESIIEWSSAARMDNFTSKSLDRTFDAIYFLSGVEKVTQ